MVDKKRTCLWKNDEKCIKMSQIFSTSDRTSEIDEILPVFYGFLNHPLQACQNALVVCTRATRLAVALVIPFFHNTPHLFISETCLSAHQAGCICTVVAILKIESFLTHVDSCMPGCPWSLSSDDVKWRMVTIGHRVQHHANRWVFL